MCISTKIHVIGKNVWKFHAIYWPALLLSAGLPLPDTIVVHGFMTVDGKKISRALNRDIEQEAPWTLLKENDYEPLRELLSRWTQSLRALAHWLAPFLPESSRKIMEILAQRPVRRATPLFPRIGGG